MAKLIDYCLTTDTSPETEFNRPETGINRKEELVTETEETEELVTVLGQETGKRVVTARGEHFY